MKIISEQINIAEQQGLEFSKVLQTEKNMIRLYIYSGKYFKSKSQISVYNELEKQFIHYHDFIQKQIQKNFQYYLYQRNGITSKIRLSQIYYIESLRHQIIIHSINGEMIERKTLSQFIKEIQSPDFIQIHKSYIINKRFIQEIKNQEVILKEQTHLPIGRSYKESLKEQN